MSKKEQPAAATDEAAPVKKGRGKLFLLAGAGALLVVLGGAVGAYFLGYLGPAEADEAVAGEEGNPAGQEETRDQAAAADHGEAAKGQGETADADKGGVSAQFVDLPDVLVNLQSDSRRSRFLKLRLSVEVADKKAGEAVQRLTPRVMDSFQVYLRALTPEDVGGSVGLQRLKEEMMARINLAIEPAQIKDVLVREMLVQ